MSALNKLVVVVCYQTMAFALALTALTTKADDESVVASDGNIEVTAAELRHIYENSKPNIQAMIAARDADRFEIVASTLLDKKIRQSLDALDPEASPELYLRYQAALRAAAKEFDKLRFQVELQLPDFDAVARERYRVSRDEIATVPEQRMASHILLLCSEGCDEEAKESELAAIGERVAAGESFSDLAMEYSQDPGSRQRGGRLSQPITQADTRIDEVFRSTTFELQDVGEVSGIVRSRFGFHIIRLEEIVPTRMRSFEEVESALLAEVEKRFREDAYREHILSLGPSEDFVIDYEAIDAVLGPVQAVDE